ncbi:MAG TPA: FAD-binding domain [Thermoanaerobaculia bacterium]|nr:FAD-binding domain [Thermoanaerobaculia bacterium]
MRVAINGIGVAGPTLAYWLREWGHEPVLFEKAPALRRGGYLIDFWGLGYEIAERMGLLPSLRDRSYEMERLKMVDGRGREEVAVDLGPMREVLDGRFISLARSDLAASLFGACRGIPARFGVGVTGIEQDDDGIVATLSDGGEERFDLVIGADGLHSKVRELAFGPEGRYERSLECSVAAFRIPGYPCRDELTYVSHTVPGRQVARVSLRGGETLVLLVCRSELLGGIPAPERQKEALRRAFGEMRWEVPDILDGMEKVDELYFDSVSQIHLPRWSSGRVGLLGDAAACPSLLAGEGAGVAMTEAYVLAGELRRSRGDFTRAFADYESRLRSFVIAKQKAALRLRSFFAPRTSLALRMRNAAVGALTVPLVGKWLVARSLRDDLDLPRYAVPGIEPEVA